MYQLSRFVRIVSDENRTVLYNYRTSGLYWECAGSVKFQELTNIINGIIDEESALSRLLFSKGFLVS